jgi:hypothetical protein
MEYTRHAIFKMKATLREKIEAKNKAVRCVDHISTNIERTWKSIEERYKIAFPCF